MKIGLISDTRAARPDQVPEPVAKALDGVDLILHAGGIDTRSVLDSLQEIAPVKAAGRTTPDRSEGPASAVSEGGGDERVAEQHVLDLDGHTIGLVHELSVTSLPDEVRPGYIAKRRRKDLSMRVVAEDFFATPIDIVVFGRTLYAMIEEHDGVLFINPGSPSYPANLRKLGTVAILDLEPGSRKVGLIDLASME